MTITIELSREEAAELFSRASRAGQDVQGFVTDIIHRELGRPTLSELLAPFRKQVQESGMTDQELTDLFEEARNEAWMERQNAT